MVRSAEAATRFTSTTPHASSKAPPSASNIEQHVQPSATRSSPRRSPGPAGETPQERVARLRAAAARARDARISTFDKVIIHGRVWADRAHRITALTLIGLTGVSGIVTVYALGDMMIYNRRKRVEYFAEQRALHESSVFEAQLAVQKGIATERQLAILDSEQKYKAADEAKTKKKGPGVFARTTGWLFSGLKKDDPAAELSAAPEATSNSDSNLEQSSRVRDVKESPIMRAVEGKKSDVKEQTQDAWDKEKNLERIGGPLDRIGGSEGTNNGQKSGGGWTSFMSRG